MNAHEIFDTFFKFSDSVQKADKTRQLENHNFKLKNKCGSCTKWMTKSCPPESRGIKITCENMICSQFNMNSWTLELIEKNTEEIKSLNP